MPPSRRKRISRRRSDRAWGPVFDGTKVAPFPREEENIREYSAASEIPLRTSARRLCSAHGLRSVVLMHSRGMCVLGTIIKLTIRG